MLAKTIERDTNLFEYCNILRTQFIKNKKILFVQLPQFQPKVVNRQSINNRGYYAYLPTGLQTLKKALKSKNLDIEILDLNYLLLKKLIDEPNFESNDWLQLLDEYLLTCSPSIIGITTISVAGEVQNPDFHLTKILLHLKNLNQYLTIIGGPIATDESDFYLNNELCHYVVKNEGENKLNLLLDYLYPAPFPSHNPIQGIHFFYKNKLHQSEGHQDIVKVQGNLVETYEEVPIEKYNLVGSLNPFSRMAGPDQHFAPIQLNRGCRANCMFCGVTEFMGKGVRQSPIDDLIDELHYLVKQRNVRHFEFLDDDLLGGNAEQRENVKFLFKTMVALRKDYPISWSAGNGLITTSLSDEIITLIEESGCIGFRIGIESGNPEMLKKIHKPTGIKSLLTIAKKIQKIPKVFVGGNFIIGFFGTETFGQMMDSFNLAIKLNIDWASFSTFQFTSKTTAKEQNFKTNGKEAKEFVPIKNFSNREIQHENKVLTGYHLFEIAPECVPDPEQIQEIWFTYNLVSNYLLNKNLRIGGNPIKYRNWLKAVQLTYPDNAYIPLFIHLASIIIGDKEDSTIHLNKCNNNLLSSKYWQQRFRQFNLDEILQANPKNKNDVYNLLDNFCKKYLTKLDV